AQTKPLSKIPLPARRKPQPEATIRAGSGEARWSGSKAPRWFSLRSIRQIARQRGARAVLPQRLQRLAERLGKSCRAADLAVDVFHGEPGGRVVLGLCGSRLHALPVGIVWLDDGARIGGAEAVAAPQ